MKQGEAILNLVRNMQKLNSEVAALLRTYERSLADHGFRNERGSAVTKDCSYSIGSPELWTPPWMYRVLNNRKDKDDVIVLNIILDEPDQPESVKEPLLLCARFKYQKCRAKDSVGEWDPCDLWFCGDPKEFNRVYSMQDLRIDSKEFLSESEWVEIDAIEDICFIAVPLANMTDSRILHDQVIRRIL